VRNFPRFEVPADFKSDRAILYTGEVSPDYGVWNLLEIARELKRRGIRAPMRIVDRFREQTDIRAAFDKAIREEGLDLEILDSVPSYQMPNLLAKGCIGLSPLSDLPNKRLALPTKIFEYFAFGLVVLASDVEGTRDILDHGRLGFLLPDHDHRAWVDAIERLLDDPALLEEYRQRGFEAAASIYRWENEESRLVDYVRELIARQPKPAAG